MDDCCGSINRLPGIRFRVKPSRAGETLPRMDIAAFVGFASSGPVDFPVPVEDMNGFRKHFGDDLPLALDPAAGRVHYAYLASAVEAFFKNGGKRCWVVRVDINNKETGKRNDFGAELFLDSKLADVGTHALVSEANSRYFMRKKFPKGIHRLLCLDEVTLVVVPDAVHTGWEIVAESPLQPLAAPGLRLKPPVEGETGEAPNTAVLEWDEVSGALYTLQESTDPLFIAPVFLYNGKETCQPVTSGIACTRRRFYRVNARVGERISPWSDTLEIILPYVDFNDCTEHDVVDAGGPYPEIEHIDPGNPADSPWSVKGVKDYADGELVTLHRALLRFCAARGDVLTVLSLPQHYKKDDLLNHLKQLKSPAGDIDILSYGALYHPWILTGSETGGGTPRYVPPDGAVCGTIAARAIRRGAWIAPANEPLQDVMAVEPDIHQDDWEKLFRNQVNIVRQDPRGFMLMSAFTLSPNPALRPVNVRRLLILLRRLALREGMKYVFLPNNIDFQRMVHHSFEQLLSRMYALGAFAGNSPQASFQVVTDSSVNTPADLEQGRFIVELRVAPSRPMAFIVVRLVQSQDEGLSILEI